MEHKQFQRRSLALVLLLAFMLTGMGATLYDLQINNGQDYYQQSQTRIVETDPVARSWTGTDRCWCPTG